jgi:hypothetical protein
MHDVTAQERHANRVVGRIPRLGEFLGVWVDAPDNVVDAIVVAVAVFLDLPLKR